jgi:hypothetical protein
VSTLCFALVLLGFAVAVAFTLLKPAAGAKPRSAAYYCFRIQSWILADYLTIQGQGGKVQSREGNKSTIQVGETLRAARTTLVCGTEPKGITTPKLNGRVMVKTHVIVSIRKYS